MANEFEIISSEGQRYDKMTLWKCNQCGAEIRASGKPRSHVCLHQEEASSTPQTIQRSGPGPSTPYSPIPEVLTDPAIVRQQLQRPPLTGYPFSPTIPNPNAQPAATPSFPRPPVFQTHNGVFQPHSAP